MGQTGFFDVERRLEAIRAKGDPLETIKKIVPWEDFRADMEAVTETKPEERKSNAGRKPYDAILKIRDRISFMRFLDLELGGPGAGCYYDLAVSQGVGANWADRQVV